MLFNSVHFVFFFPIVAIIYFALPNRWRWLHLLLSSYYFYMSWRVEYALLIILSTIIDYFASIQMGKLDNSRARKKYLYLSLFVNLGLLFVFKYAGFVLDSVQMFVDQVNIFYEVPEFNILLPVGISFYTFQTLSYTVDVYKGDLKPEKHFGKFALYVAFWPQLVAGPIERASRLLPQFHDNHRFNYERVRSGLTRMGWGFAKKLIVADRLAVYVNAVFNNPEKHEGWPVIVAIYFFAFQIYCDFSGYSDIAIGAARVMGFDLMENFKTPYFSKSVSEFWQRWHISLSTWFRDYVYIPLGGNRTKMMRWCYNIMVTFLVSGLWHGANWNFVLWGGLHGLYLLMERGIGKLSAFTSVSNNTFVRFAKIMLTFHLVLIGWIIFRANYLGDVPVLLNHAFQNVFTTTAPAMFQGVDFYLAILFVLLLMICEYWLRQTPFESKIAEMSTVKRWTWYIGMATLTLWFGVFSSSEFIYFQF